MRLVRLSVYRRLGLDTAAVPLCSATECLCCVGQGAAHTWVSGRNKTACGGLCVFCG
jgi:hypothetical protein